MKINFTQNWENECKDNDSGRTIYARNMPLTSNANTGTYDFALVREFQVRSPKNDVLLQVVGSSKGEYWCGVFLFFIDGTNGTKVRLEESDKLENTYFDVPNKPILDGKVWK